jgi:hypothetical protein
MSSPASPKGVSKKRKTNEQEGKELPQNRTFLLTEVEWAYVCEGKHPDPRGVRNRLFKAVNRDQVLRFLVQDCADFDVGEPDEPLPPCLERLPVERKTQLLQVRSAGGKWLQLLTPSECAELWLYMNDATDDGPWGDVPEKHRATKTLVELAFLHTTDLAASPMTVEMSDK